MSTLNNYLNLGTSSLTMGTMVKIEFPAQIPYYFESRINVATHRRYYGVTINTNNGKVQVDTGTILVVPFVFVEPIDISDATVALSIGGSATVQMPITENFLLLRRILGADGVSMAIEAALQH
jgi:hypothetical protein